MLGKLASYKNSTHTPKQNRKPQFHQCGIFKMIQNRYGKNPDQTVDISCKECENVIFHMEGTRGCRDGANQCHQAVSTRQFRTKQGYQFCCTKDRMPTDDEAPSDESFLCSNVVISGLKRTQTSQLLVERKMKEYRHLIGYEYFGCLKLLLNDDNSFVTLVWFSSASI